MFRVALLLVCAMTLSACVQTTLIQAGKQRVNGTYSVTPVNSWNGISGVGQNLWTQDGLGLQELSFFDAVPNGETLLKNQTGAEKEFPKFRDDMRANDIMEFVASSLGVAGAQSMETGRLRPFSFSGHRGFRFDLDFITARGAQIKGEAFGAVIDKKLHLITYLGHPEYYFDKARAEVEEMMRTLSL